MTNESKQTNGNGLTGKAGEHAVAFELLNRGFEAVITRGNAQSIDIFACKNDGQNVRSVSIQVKSTKTLRAIGWCVRREQIRKGCIYVLVGLHPAGQRPDFYILTAEEMLAVEYRWPKTRSMLVLRDLASIADVQERWEKIEAALS